MRGAALRLGYQPNLLGQALRRGSSASIGMILPGLHNPFYATLVHAVEAALQEDGYQLLISDSHADTGTELARLRMLLARRVDGLLLVPAFAEGSEQALIEAESAVPTVQVDRRVSADIADSVGVDNTAAMRLVLEHLHSRGVRSAAYIGSDDATMTGRERHAAAITAADELGVRIESVHRHSFESDTGAEGVRAVPTELPEAIICGDDLIALGALKELRRRGAAVPDDVLVTGFDDTRFAELMHPSVTSIAQPLELLARTAVDMLTARIHGVGAEPEAVLLPPRLVIRESTTPTHR
ncbi:hypothetical protein ASF46_13030 [Rathayibacter sp. Leaf296]|nr:hypothetical protein ASF46_13030 [Rathayibacter sp. Leaf296]